MLTSAASACYYGWTGIGQHANATQIDSAIATLFALKGQVDAPGGNVAWPAPKTNPIDDPGLLSPEQRQKRSEERRVGTECVSTCRSRGSRIHLTRNHKKHTTQRT